MIETLLSDSDKASFGSCTTTCSDLKLRCNLSCPEVPSILKKRKESLLCKDDQVVYFMGAVVLDTACHAVPNRFYVNTLAVFGFYKVWLRGIPSVNL